MFPMYGDMLMMKIRRKAASTKGFLRRLEDARFEQVDDPRELNRITHPLEPVLNLAVLSLVTAARSTRAVEQRSEGLKHKVKRHIGLADSISDNAFGLLMARLEPNDLRKVLRSQIKAEWRRKNLGPTVLPWSTVAIDGKHMATITEQRLRALISQTTPFDGDKLELADVRRLLESRFPQVQLHEKDGRFWGLVRVHRATLVSSAAAVVMDQQTLMGETNEWGTILKTLRGLFGHYGKSNMVELVTMDAGNTTQDAASFIAKQQADYFLAIKSVQGHLFDLAEIKLGPESAATPVYARSEEYNGQTVCYSVFRHNLPEGFGRRHVRCFASSGWRPQTIRPRWETATSSARCPQTRCRPSRLICSPVLTGAARTKGTGPPTPSGARTPPEPRGRPTHRACSWWGFCAPSPSTSWPFYAP